MYAKESQDLLGLNHSLQVLEIQSFQKLIGQAGENFIQQHYTTIERSVSDTRKRRIQYLAGRWAAKNAIASVLSLDRKRSNSWLDIEIPRLPTGQPSVTLLDRCQQEAIRLGIKQWFISISHTSTYAVASVAARK